jgi:alpha-galactosidase
MHTWTISSPTMARTLEFSEGAGGLRTSAWLHRRTNTDYMTPIAGGADAWNMEFSLCIDSAPPLHSRAPHVRLLHHDQTDHTLTLVLAADGVEIELTYTTYAQHSVLRKGLIIRNRRATPITITQLILESLELCAGLPEDQMLYGFYGTQPRELFISGRMDDAAIYQRNVRTGEGFVAMNEAPGILKRINTSWTWQCGVQLLYDTDIFSFERVLQPDEAFSAAKVGIAFTHENTAAAPQWVLPHYTSTVLHRQFAPVWIYNTWETFFRDIDQPLIENLIPLAAQMGYDVFTIDDGWQAQMGSNAVRTSHFPDGLDSLRRQVEAHGMRLGLWFALAVVDADADVVRAHPEWRCHDGTGQPRHTFTMSGLAPVMCLATPYRDVVTAQIADAVRHYNLRYIKLDLTTVFNTYGEGPGCTAAGHEHRSWAESLTRIYEAIGAITQALYAQFPDLLIDLTFELWGQKHLIDYGLLAYGDLDWLSNIHDLNAAGPRQARTLLYQRALAMPTESLLIGNLQADVGPIAERFATAIASAPLLLGDLRKLTAEQIAWYRAKIDWFKQLRRDVPLQHSFFVLGTATPNAAAWDGFARLSHAGEGVIALFANASAATHAQIALPLFTPHSYRLHSVMRNTTLGTYSAAQLRDGIDLPLPSAASGGVDVLEMRIV